LKTDSGAILDGRCCVPGSSSDAGSSPDKPQIMAKEAVVERIEPVHHEVPAVITKRHRAYLRARGFEEAAIDKMTPGEAHKILGLA
jgi:hypothetical protein